MKEKLTIGCVGLVFLLEDYKSDSAMQQQTTKINLKHSEQCPRQQNQVNKTE